MQKRLLAVAVAGALAAPAIAMAQTSVTISGTANLWYESAEGKGATNASSGVAGTPSTFDVKQRDRIGDGAGSNIRFTAVEDIGGGLQAFAQIESAVLSNADTRANAIGTAGAAVSGWANRNSGVGLRGKAWGEFLLGIWDTHYTESYPVDNQLLKSASHASSLGLLHSFGTAGWATGAGSLGGATIGARYSNVIRYQSPSWGGFNFRASMVRPTDGLVNTTQGSVNEGTKNRAWNIAPTFASGPIYVSWSFLKDNDITATTATTYTGATGGPTVAATLYDITSNRIHAAYTFPFGLKLGVIYDNSKLEGKATAANSDSELKRNVVSLPISWTTGPHAIFFTYARASKLKGTINNVDVGSINITPAVGVGGTASPQSIGGNSGARFISLGYQFDLSKRTTLHLTFAQITNDSLAGYDFFANPIGMANGNFGADPRVYAVGLRHAF